MQENTSSSNENEQIESLQDIQQEETNENLTEKTIEEATPSDENEVPTENILNSKIEEELAEWKDKYLRLFAEFDNYKKRSFKEKMDVIQTGGKDVIVSLLDVMDDMARAEKQMESATDTQSVKEGMQLVFNKLRNTLQGKGLKAFDSIGEAFDVEKHEAVTEIPASPEMEGKVMDELQKGYTLNDKLIRHAKVVVGKLG
jgi:molecular chaperone GrpE